jgi:hypothetical protein
MCRPLRAHRSVGSSHETIVLKTLADTLAGDRAWFVDPSEGRHERVPIINDGSCPVGRPDEPLHLDSFGRETPDDVSMAVETDCPAVRRVRRIENRDCTVGFSHKCMFVKAVLLGVRAANAAIVIDRERNCDGRATRIETRDRAVGRTHEPARVVIAYAIKPDDGARRIDAHGIRERRSRNVELGKCRGLRRRHAKRQHNNR